MSCEGSGREAGSGEMLVAKAGERVKGRWKGGGLCIRTRGVWGGGRGQRGGPQDLCWALGTVQTPEV